MKRILVTSVMLSLLTLGSVFAADLPSADQAPVLKGPVAAPGFSWSGFYVGADAGWVNSSAHAVDLSGADPSFASDVNGGTIGLLAGYNFQYNNLVFGLEGDGSLMSGTGTKFPADASGTTTMHSREDAAGHLRVRLGYASGPALFYVAGGLSLADEKLSLTNPGSTAVAITKTMSGYNVGAGAEYAFTPNWLGRIEYIHDEFGSRFFGYNALNPFYDNRSVTLRDDLVRAALIYKF